MPAFRLRIPNQRSAPWMPTPGSGEPLHGPGDAPLSAHLGDIGALWYPSRAASAIFPGLSLSGRE